MSSGIFGARAPAATENAPLQNGKIQAQAPAPGVQRRALGEIGNGANAAAAPRAPIARALPVFGVGHMAGGDVGMAAHVEAPAAFGGIPPEMDVDSADIDDPTAVADYVTDIYRNYKAAEVTRSASSTYMRHQADINEKMRAILIDWLVEVHLKFKLMPETMYLTVNIIDRYLERKQVIRQKLQLVGVTAMLLASKYEEIYAPEVRDFVYITDKAYTKEQILAMEASMLNTLEFRITVPTAYVFLNRYLKVANAHTDIKAGYFATYLTERMLQEYRMLAHAPSKVAAACVNISLRTLRGRGAWDRKMEFHSGFRQEELRACIKDVEDILANAHTSTLKAVAKKYALPKFGEVAGISPIALE